jgi:Sulfotransferase domain
MTQGVRVAVWSGPRNISTALMRSWENRPDCRVVDEPLYAYFLTQTGIDHPGRDEVLATNEDSWQGVVRLLTASTEGIYYQKHMAHHLVGPIRRDWIGTLCNFLLIRNPRDVVASYVRSRPEVSLSDLGLVQLTELHEQLGDSAPVIDADDFLDAPEVHLRWMCRAAGVEFTDAMLHWPPGPRESDGPWAKYWYASVTASTGFEARRHSSAVELGQEQKEVLDQAWPYYERLRSARLMLI